ncbi:hypothetical protein E1265_14745 [Streptomyces sp. 8K308]|nr:ALF repeat-containing protein [Streptomyces sp. 8K308]TDC22808.1 hypothetical protein E1265_14745 [Streptomyces sp. 8K308]
MESRTAQPLRAPEPGEAPTTRGRRACPAARARAWHVGVGEAGVRRGRGQHLHTARENNDKAVIREATAALEAGTPEAVREFRESGYRLAQFEDDKVAVFRILADPTISDALRAAAQQAIENATPESLRYFLEHGRYEVES